MKLSEMIEKRKNAVDSAIKFADSHKTERGTLTDEDYGTYQTMEKEIEDMSREISRMQRQENMQNELSKPVKAIPHNYDFIDFDDIFHCCVKVSYHRLRL